MKKVNYEVFVSLEVAKLLKKAGFDWEICDGYIIYEDDGGFTTEFQTPHNFNGDNGCLFIDYRGHKEVLSRPTLSVAQKWLREVYHIEIQIKYLYKGNPLDGILEYIWSICFTHPFPYKEFEADLNECRTTYEESLEEGIKKALELILEKGE